MSFRKFLFVLCLTPAVGSADIALIHGNESVAVVYQESTRVLYKECGRRPQFNNRQCRETEAVFPLAYRDFVQHLHALTKIPSLYQSTDGLNQITERIERINRDLASEGLPKKNRMQAQRLLENLRPIHAKLLAIKEQVLDKLPADSDVSFDSAYDPNYLKTYWAFYSVWFDGGSRVWILGSSSAQWERQNERCPSPWHAAHLSDFGATVNGIPVREFLHDSPVGRSVGTGWKAWTSGSAHPSHGGRRWSIYDPRLGQIVRLGPISQADRDAHTRLWIAAGERLYFDYTPVTASYAVFCVWE